VRHRHAEHLNDLLGPAASISIDGPPAPAHLPGVGLEHPERDPHRRCRPGTVGPDEPDDRPLRHRERNAVECDDVAVATREIDEFEHGRRQDTVEAARPADAFCCLKPGSRS
jgi:hypothetical protein